MTGQETVFGKRILLAEDDPGVREALKLMLHLDRHTVTEASNGREALALFSPDQFDLVITDYLMPEMQGDELARNIKRLAPGRPVLMVTAYLEKLLALGHLADTVLAKPIDLDGLRRAIAHPLQTLSPSAAADPLPAESLSPQKLGARAAAKSSVLAQILGYDSDTAFLRGWGIND